MLRILESRRSFCWEWMSSSHSLILSLSSPLPLWVVIGEQKVYTRACKMSVILLRPACAGWRNSQGHPSSIASSSLSTNMCDRSRCVSHHFLPSEQQTACVWACRLSVSKNLSAAASKTLQGRIEKREQLHWHQEQCMVSAELVCVCGFCRGLCVIKGNQNLPLLHSLSTQAWLLFSTFSNSW